MKGFLRLIYEKFMLHIPNHHIYELTEYLEFGSQNQIVSAAVIIKQQQDIKIDVTKELVALSNHHYILYSSKDLLLGDNKLLQVLR